MWHSAAAVDGKQYGGLISITRLYLVGEFIHLFRLETAPKVRPYFSLCKLEDTWIISLAQRKSNGYGMDTKVHTTLRMHRLNLYFDFLRRHCKAAICVFVSFVRFVLLILQ